MPEATLENAEWGGYDQDSHTVTSSLSLSVLNRNLFDIPLKGITYRFTMFGVVLADGSAGLSQSIKKESHTPFTFPVSIHLDKSFDLAVKMLENKTWPWDFRGSLAVDVPISSLDLPYHKGGEWQRPEMLDGLSDTLGTGLKVARDLKDTFSDVFNGLSGLLDDSNQEIDPH